MIKLIYLCCDCNLRMNQDTLFEIFKYLSLNDLYNCLLVDKNFNEIAIHDSNWKNQLTLLISENTIQKIFTEKYKDTLAKYLYFINRFDWIHLISLEDKAYRFFKQEKSLVYKLYTDSEINGHTVTNYIPTTATGFHYIPELSEIYLKLFRKARPNYMCLMTIRVFVKDDSMIMLIDSEVDEVFVFINGENEYNIVGCMDQDNDGYNCYIASNENAYYNTDSEAQILFYTKYDFSDKNPVLKDSLLDHIHNYFNEGLLDTWH